MFLQNFSAILKNCGKHFVPILEHFDENINIFVQFLEKLSEKYEIILRQFWKNLGKL